MPEQPDETWAYDEPHESGGNCHITMTRRQAIDWFYRVYPLGTSDEESLFDQWKALHWAYKADADVIPRHAVAEALDALLEKVSATRQMGSGISTYALTMPEVIKEINAAIAKLGLDASDRKLSSPAELLAFIAEMQSTMTEQEKLDLHTVALGLDAAKEKQ